MCKLQIPHQTGLIEPRGKWFNPTDPTHVGVDQRGLYYQLK